ncbi:hypothetical protein [Bosea sp. RAC05]|uniref:hypothetical protein n=1 Tax=Bosea sp. RAC05 TaxID=1842539 RepID=UPI00083D2307|nr:hypothetical protein [Bosea sp. RAC05]AOG02978.1 AAA domain protein [Bosea sp. RAC05]
MKITLVAGLPGSGKSTLLKTYAGQGAVIIDDIASLDELPQHAVNWLAIADVNFCDAEIRKAALSVIEDRFPDAIVEWVFFDNDPAACLENAGARNDGRNVAPDITALSKRYEIPPGHEVLPVAEGTPRPRR